MRRAVALAAALVAVLASSAGAASFHVGSKVDALDVRPGDGLCVTVSATCTLRAAIREANLSPEPQGYRPVQIGRSLPVDFVVRCRVASTVGCL